jgi:hypothetical protein
MDTSLAQKGAEKEIPKGHRYNYAMLAASGAAEMRMGVRVVDFGRIFSNTAKVTMGRCPPGEPSSVSPVASVAPATAGANAC